MPERGSNKDRANKHEGWIASLYEGRRTSNSGADTTDLGDVRVKTGQVRADQFLFECKTTGQPGKPAKSTLLKQFTKAADEAYAEGRQPAMALQFYDPQNPLAGVDGFVNLTVRLSVDDADWIKRALDPPVAPGLFASTNGA